MVEGTIQVGEVKNCREVGEVEIGVDGAEVGIVVVVVVTDRIENGIILASWMKCNLYGTAWNHRLSTSCRQQQAMIADSFQDFRLVTARLGPMSES